MTSCATCLVPGSFPGVTPGPAWCRAKAERRASKWARFTNEPARGSKSTNSGKIGRVAAASPRAASPMTLPSRPGWNPRRRVT